MKSLKYIIFGLIAISSFTSCDNDKDFLTEDPNTIYTPETAFEKSSQVDAQLATAYRKAFGMYGEYAMFWTGRSTQQLLHGQGADFFDNGTIGVGLPTANAFSNFALWNQADPKFNGLWNDMYQLISYANMSLQGAEQVNWSDESDKEYAIAQAKFFRAYGYLRLAECFGGVPYVTTVSEELKLDYTRESRETIYRYVIADLEAAAADLPLYPMEDGRIAQGAANHFLAEAYLALGVETNNADGDNYDKAIAAATVTINAHPLMTERFGSRANPADLSENNGVPAYKPDGNVFYDLFQIGNYDYSEGNTEAVWTLEAATYDEAEAAGLRGGWTGGNPYYVSAFVGPVTRNMTWKEGTPEAEENVGGPFSDNIDTELYPGGVVSAYLGGFTVGGVAETKYVSEKVWAGDYADDIRNAPINICRELLCVNTESSRYGTYVSADDLEIPAMMSPLRSKIAMQDDWGWHETQLTIAQAHVQQYGRDFYAVRSSETLLLRAEAYYRNGDSDSAAADIKVIRDRAQASKEITAGEIDIYTILAERARELAYEEHRWPTLLRMGSSIEETNEVMVHQIENHAMFVADVPYYTNGINWTLFPIPETVMVANAEGGLEQNPGW